ncbi:DUF4012 domain-containing protein [Microbacterium elymi]|uniref:DUF4012 domain-containing protein n=1 Tax=Microbacterium elymi TaxID=2909587 RepID=A0ABY5NMZ2_9MICO|nr:DUF4012 domain-containing protein [Microbacterium elymi]UUT36520.1 DUF4012 domain-containing protein [Microbacterium elymi]
MTDQTSTYSFRRDIKVIDPPEQMQALYDSETFTGFGNFTRTPNFPTTAEAFNSLWNITTGSHLDGVVTVDPVVLSHILAVTGPVTAADGTKLTSGNVVKTLLYDTYQRYSGAQAGPVLRGCRVPRVHEGRGRQVGRLEDARRPRAIGERASGCTSGSR